MSAIAYLDDGLARKQCLRNEVGETPRSIHGEKSMGITGSRALDNRLLRSIFKQEGLN
jgi:hypothetical protein